MSDKESENDTFNQSNSSTLDGAQQHNATGEDEKKQDTHSSIQRHDVPFFGIPASPPVTVSLEQIMNASSHFSRMALVHEIAVNEEFLLKKRKPKEGLEKQVHEVIHEIFWDNLQLQLMETPPDYSQALVLLKEIKEALLEVILPHQEAMQRYINEKLDLDLIQQQVENNVLDFQQYADFIISTMAKLCAPIRDEKIQELKSVTEIVPLYKGILETLDLMKLDLANYTINALRPHMQQHSAEYEKGKFREFLNSLAAMNPPVDGLQLTKEWFKSVCTKVKVQIPNDKRLTNSQLIAKAFIEVLQWDENCVFPETLQMDKERFLSIRKEFLMIVITASVLLLTYSFVGESIQGIGSLKLRLKDQLSVLLESASNVRSEKLKEYLQSVEVQVIKEVNDCLLEHGFSELCDSKRNLLSAQICEIQSTEHNVRKIITTRILEFMENILNSSKTASAPVKIPLGLSAFNKELSNIGGAFLRLVTHNLAVFNDYYIDIISKTIQDD